MDKKRIILDYNDFDKLIKGEIIIKDDVDISLSDIGWYNMIDIIKMNINEPKKIKSKET